ncbi:TAXI family TRAP transporter solute-binding subunit [Plastoroseomonas hellenica]|uniref:TAXI family TRAP transporter solute-binding subunit n=1 Tax=Plastoroseomonas hellenica TaxID=2687306 RepID=UPI001BAB8F43|nr:TAXI family TRAP transporter solute-binding subunit [Plastoroseomonas hellenica]MBR0644210.1 TAXI family TRAP transporter solute-binding subunit [Plastoroseomonas hellenica]
MNDNEASPVRLGTATPGGGFPAYGAAFAAAVNAVDPGLAVTPQHTKGSAENVPLLIAGALDIALVAGETAVAALGGPSPLTVVAAMYATPGLFAVRADAPWLSLADLRGQRIAWGARGSGFIVLARQMTAGLGLDMERDFAPVFLDHAGDGPAMVLDGSVAALWGGGAGWPGFTAIAAEGARFIAPDPGERVRILTAEPGLRAMELPADSYSGQSTPIASVGTWSYVLARPDLPEALGHRLAAALHEAGPDLAARLPQGRETTLANTLAAAPSPETLHPGVRRYLREIGLGS